MRQGKNNGVESINVFGAMHLGEEGGGGLGDDDLLTFCRYAARKKYGAMHLGRCGKNKNSGAEHRKSCFAFF